MAGPHSRIPVVEAIKLQHYEKPHAKAQKTLQSAARAGTVYLDLDEPPANHTWRAHAQA